jgi:CheY-like chemotaxis protein
VAKPRVLLVDDDRDTRSVLKSFLERLKIAVLEAGDGYEALTVARARQPDLIVMDVRMPGMDGLEACRAIRADEALRAIPVIVLSGATRRARLDEIAKLDGVPLYDEFVSKPFQYAAVLDLVKQRLGMA